MRASLSAGTTVWGPAGTESGLGDLTLFDVPLFQLASAKMGIGPLLILPTATSPALGERKWQGGAQAVVSAPYAWGLAAASGIGQPSFQVFAGFNIQFPPGRSP